MARSSRTNATPAQVVAEKLTVRFLEEGNFSAAGSVSGAAIDRLYPAATQGPDIEPFFDEAGFAGLSVQAVGYEQGVPDAKVHVYVSKGSRKTVESLPTSGGDVEVEVNKIGKLVIKPDKPLSATNRGNVYLRGNRVACGSSCAPSKEVYSGTFGAIVRKVGDMIFTYFQTIMFWPPAIIRRSACPFCRRVPMMPGRTSARPAKSLSILRFANCAAETRPL